MLYHIIANNGNFTAFKQNEIGFWTFDGRERIPKEKATHLDFELLEEKEYQNKTFKITNKENFDIELNLPNGDWKIIKPKETRIFKF